MLVAVPSLPVTPTALTEGEVDYRLARQNVVSAFKAGELSQHDVCDAHPELIRAAREYSTPSNDDCPICDDDRLVHVSYVFGPRLPSHGRCVRSAKDMDRLRKRKGSFSCYVVEVCPTCSFNHLRRAFALQGS